MTRRVFWSTFALSFVLLVFCLHPAFRSPLFFIDDELYLSSVPAGSLSLGKLWEIFRFVPRPAYLPLTDTTYLFDQTFAAWFSLDAFFVMRLTSVFYLALGAGMVALLALQCKIERFLAVALGVLFALHPIHASPTVWIASRKDVLVALFSIATILLFMQKKYLYAWIVFLAAFLSKQSTYALLLWIIVHECLQTLTVNRKRSWLKNLREVFLRTSPFFLLFLVLFPVSIRLSTAHPSPMVWIFPTTPKILFFYAKQVLFPYPVTQYYPRPAAFGVFLAIVAWGICAALFLYPAWLALRGKIALRWVSLWIFALATILPYAVVVPRALLINNAYAFVLVAPLLILAFGMAAERLGVRKKKLLIGIATFLFILCCPYDHFLAKDFSNPVAAFERNNALYPGDRFILMRLAHVSHLSDDTEKALRAYREALGIRLSQEKRISEDAFDGMIQIAIVEKRGELFSELEDLAAQNSQPYYCLLIAQHLERLGATRDFDLSACRKKFPQAMSAGVKN